jgi:hypothetical protein
VTFKYISPYAVYLHMFVLINLCQIEVKGRIFLLIAEMYCTLSNIFLININYLDFSRISNNNKEVKEQFPN